MIPTSLGAPRPLGAHRLGPPRPLAAVDRAPPLRALLFCAALLAAGCATSSKSKTSAEPEEALPFLRNDYPAALAQAKAQRKPLFIDVWAPWCHTCLYMNANVFSDPALKRDASRYVWLSVDTENPVNAAFVEKFPVDNWPTFMVVDSDTERPVLKWMGTATVAQLEQLFADGEKALRAPQGADPDSLLARADQLAAERKVDAAADTYLQAVRVGGKDWPRRSRAVEAATATLFAGKAYARCVEWVRTQAPGLPRNSSFANASANGLFCATSLPPGAARTEQMHALRALAEEGVTLPGLLVDDRSSLFQALTDSYEEDGNVEKVRMWAGHWLAFVEEQQQVAPTPAARMALDPHLALAAERAGQPEKAVPALLQSERERPNDYNPPARLALLYRDLGDYSKALAAHDRALSKVYGPRRIRLLEQKGETQLAMKDVSGAEKTAAQAEAALAQLPQGQRAAAEEDVLRLEKSISSAH